MSFIGPTGTIPDLFIIGPTGTIPKALLMCLRHGRRHGCHHGRRGHSKVFILYTLYIEYLADMGQW